MTSKLVIVESPTKAKTISKFLGKDYKVESSFGHLRDLPKSKMGVDIEHDFKPEYTIPSDKKKKVESLKKLAAKASEIYYATDEDREGEAISWHLQQLFNNKKAKEKRIVFHEITKSAILEALENPRQIDINLVNAQQARRILDRLVGYELSPLLWKKVARGLSAGRVQSVAVRLIVEREREIEAFNPEEYWSIEVDLEATGGLIRATLTSKDNKRLDKFAISNETEAKAVTDVLNKAEFTVEAIDEKIVSKNPYPPFKTSTLQQAANNTLGFSAKQTMMIAQQLYEGINIGTKGTTGLITYMRTDSVVLADKFKTEADAYITKKFGKAFSHLRNFKNNSKNAQEAHEGIRPTEVIHDPESIKQYLDDKQYKLYKMIWNRAVASQMAAAQINQTAIQIKADRYGLRANGSTIAFPGWLKLYPKKLQENLLTKVQTGEILKLKKLNPEQHFTQPPGRYTEASLVKALEQLSIGRPSTYAPTISTIQARNYVEKENGSLRPTEIGKLVNDLLVANFKHVVDYDFTADVEDDFDKISNGNLEWHEMLAKFYKPFHENLKEKEETITKESATEMRELGKHPETGKPIYVRIGRFGPYVQHGSKDDEDKPDFASIPKSKSMDSITLEEALTYLSLPRTLYKDKDAGDIITNIGRFGPYLKIGEKFLSLKEDNPYTITVERARELVDEFKKLEAEKIIKEFSEEHIIVQHGRYGPYITNGEINAKIPKDTEPADLTLEQCKELIEEAAKNPKRGRGRRRPATKKIL